MIYTRIILVLFLIVNMMQRIESELLIRKCCPETQQLDRTLKVCVDYTSSRSIYISKKIKSVKEVRTIDNPDFPWWMDSEILPLSSESLATVPSFLREQSESKYIEFDMKPNCSFNENSKLSSKSRNINLLSNGSLVYHAGDLEDSKNIIFEPTSYCVDRVDFGIHVYLLCSCLETMCIKKCCSFKKMLSVENKRNHLSVSCLEKNVRANNYSFRPTFYSNRKTITDTPQYVLFNNEMVCGKDRMQVLITPSMSDFWMYTNGSVLVENYGHHIPYSPDQYCWDMTYNETGDNFQSNVMICAAVITPSVISFDGVYYSTLCIISSIFLVLTLVVFAVVPMTHGLTQNIVVCHVICLLVQYVIMAVMHLNKVLTNSLCISIPFVIQFCSLASFFWLNVMCVDISSTLRNPIQRQRRRLFVYYSLYAWGCPAIISSVTAVMEFEPSISDYYIKPNFGVSRCWFKGNSAVLAYYYGPMAMLQLINLLLFIYCMAIVTWAKSDQRNDSNRSHQSVCNPKNRLVLFTKLFCLMGVTWITEIISWAVGGHKIIWYVTDAINLLRSVFIFIIFCCRRHILKQIKRSLYSSTFCRRLCPSCIRSGITSSMSSNSSHRSSVESLQMAQLEPETQRIFLLSPSPTSVNCL